MTHTTKNPFGEGENPLDQIQDNNEMVEYYRYKDSEEFKLKLATGPKDEWCQTRELGGGRKSIYMPHYVIEAISDLMFKSWNIIDEKFYNITNEICCTVKIEALPDFPGADPIVFTGSGSKQVQAAKGSKVENFPVGKMSNALEYCLPAARTEAVGNAFSTLGNIFGRNLNRECINDFGFNLKYNKNEK